MEDQAEQHRTWWQQLKKYRVAIGVVAIVLVVVIALFIAGYLFDWTGFNGYNKVTITHTISGPSAGTVTRTEEYQPGKTLWDWLGLLAILSSVFVTGLAAAWTVTTQIRDNEANRAQQAKESDANREKQHQTELEIAEKNRERQLQTDLEIADNQRETALRGYIDKISELLLKEHLGEITSEDKLPPQYEKVRKIARVYTLTVLPRLDGMRTKSVLQFLHEFGLIVKGKSIIPLNGANLSGTDLSGTDLSGADLSGANLTGARLFGATLMNANLKDAIGVTVEELEQAKSLKGATMPV